MRTTLITILLVFGVGLGLSLAQGGDDAGVKKLNEEYAAAIQKRDVKAVVACHTEDAVRATPGGIAVGHAKIEAAVTEQFAGAAAGSVSLTIHDTKMLTGEVAIVHGAYKTSNGGGHFIRTLVKKGDGWKIAAIQVAADAS